MLDSVEKIIGDRNIVSHIVDFVLRSNGFVRGFVTFIENPYCDQNTNFRIGERLYFMFNCKGIPTIIIVDKNSATIAPMLKDYMLPNIDIKALDPNSGIGCSFEFLPSDDDRDIVRDINRLVERYYKNLNENEEDEINMIDDIISKYRKDSNTYIINKFIDDALIIEGFKRSYITKYVYNNNMYRDMHMFDGLYYTFTDSKDTIIIIVISNNTVYIGPVSNNRNFPNIDSTETIGATIKDKTINGILKTIESLLHFYYADYDYDYKDIIENFVEDI